MEGYPTFRTIPACEGVKQTNVQRPEGLCLNLREIILRPVAVSEEARFQALLQAHHYLGSLPKIGHTL